MIAMTPSTINVDGKTGWTATDVNGTTALLNVTRQLAISNGNTSGAATQFSGSFNESINLATRVVSFFPVLMPEIDQALQMAQTSMATGVPVGVSWGPSLSMFDYTMMNRPVYTMWWVNGPLKLNQTIPVLVLPTNVTGTTALDLGSMIGTRSAWTLEFNIPRTQLPPSPMVTSSPAIPLGDNLELDFTFNYDQTSDLLLGARADIHLGFEEETIFQPNPCSPSISTGSCPVSANPITILREFGIDVRASLKLASTNVDLAHRMTLTGSSQNQNNGSPSSTGQGSTQVTGIWSDSSPRTAGTTSGAGQHTRYQAQPKSATASASWMPLVGILGVAAAAAVGSGVWIGRRQLKKTRLDHNAY
jgi:hypothetical protein